MSLYNALFGVNPFAAILLQALDISENDVPRFRDIYLDEEQDQIVIHTRTGGGNREYYEDENEHLRTVPGFIYDHDDDYDCTYADFFYEVPESFKPMIATLRELGGADDPVKKWEKLLSDMETGNLDTPEGKRAMAVGEQILGQINKALDDKQTSCK